MSVSPARILDQRGAVVAVDRVSARIYELTVELPALAETAQPGQFAQLRIAGSRLPLLRRPFSVAHADPSTGRCRFIFGPVGTATAAMVRLRPGDEIEALGPLGRGFPIVASDGALLVSGGLGCAPLPWLASRLGDRGTRVVVLSGAASGDELYPAQRFRLTDSTLEVVEATDDGSVGHRGFVTDLVPGRLSPSWPVYACGPNPMLAALWRLLEHEPLVAGYASLEAAMGCGFGTCLGCAVPVHDGAEVRWSLCCSDGPVFDLKAVDWAELLDISEHL